MAVGVDVVFDDSDSFNDAGEGELFLVDVTAQLRQYLPKTDYVLSHSPRAQYFSFSYNNNSHYPRGAYRNVINSRVDNGSKIGGEFCLVFHRLDLNREWGQIS